MKKKTTGQLKKQLWKLFSEYVRRKDAHRTSGMALCYTCGALKHWKELQASHFIPKAVTGLSLYFDERAVKPACYRCNINLSGNWLAFERHLIDDYGQETVDDLKRLATTVVRDFPYLEKIEEYKEKLNAL